MSRLKKNPEEKAINKSISFRLEDFEHMNFLAKNVFFLPEDKLSHIIQRALEMCYNAYNGIDEAEVSLKRGSLQKDFLKENTLFNEGDK